MAQKVVCFSLCYYALLIWLLQWLLPFLKKLKEPGCSLDQGGSQCSDRAAGDVLGDAEQAKRVRTVEQTPQSWLRTSGLPVAVRRLNPRSGMSWSAAASLLHAVAFGLRAPLAGDQVEQLISLWFWLFERSLRSKV